MFSAAASIAIAYSVTTAAAAENLLALGVCSRAGPYAT